MSVLAPSRPGEAAAQLTQALPVLLVELCLLDIQDLSLGDQDNVDRHGRLVAPKALPQHALGPIAADCRADATANR
jgi:hypothetical protein